MKVGDVVRCKITKAANTVGVVAKIEKPIRPGFTYAVQVLTDGHMRMLAVKSLEVISASR